MMVLKWIMFIKVGQEQGKYQEVDLWGGVKVQHVLSHVISDYGLSNGMYSSLVVNGKKII